MCPLAPAGARKNEAYSYSMLFRLVPSHRKYSTVDRQPVTGKPGSRPEESLLLLQAPLLELQGFLSAVYLSVEVVYLQIGERPVLSCLWQLQRTVWKIDRKADLLEIWKARGYLSVEVVWPDQLWAGILDQQRLPGCIIQNWCAFESSLVDEDVPGGVDPRRLVLPSRKYVVLP